jgi:hypothetical protein
VPFAVPLVGNETLRVLDAQDCWVVAALRGIDFQEGAQLDACPPHIAKHAPRTRAAR